MNASGVERDLSKAKTPRAGSAQVTEGKSSRRESWTGRLSGTDGLVFLPSPEGPVESLLAFWADRQDSAL